ncbi:MAG: AmpG family muropeptide MFS transporter [Candidatus Thiodiazotropha sp. (ex Monitilora ramsayi)]|nr:AmpG family muropeptide MFS transporter [Candidatus Thiodiazotropha sp. (ex Monitilora ramsayi)]
MHPPRSINAIAATLFSRRMIITLAMGFASGLPLLLTGSVLQAWMTAEKVDLTTIGLFALVGLPYTLKFLWAPVLDRYTPTLMGRRRSWLLISQICLILSILALSLGNPQESVVVLGITAVLLTFFSASQDVVIDAYRRESLPDNELGLGASLYVNGYRVGMLLASGGGLILADIISFPQVYQVMALIMFVGVLTTLFAPEPESPAGRPKSLREAVIDPFLEYFNRQDAVLILLFILLYKVGDTMASHMSTPFYLDIGFSNTEIGTLVKLFGFWATIAGGFIGGLILLRISIYKGLVIFGILQGLSTAGFALLAVLGHNLAALAAVITFENLSSGLGTAAYVAFMASLTNKRFTATQYALLSSFMGIPRVIVASPTGLMADTMGWVSFFVFCALIALPGLLLLRWLQVRGLDEGLQTRSEGGVA